MFTVSTLISCRNLFYSITHFPSTELTKQGMEIYKEEFESVKSISGFGSPWISYSIPAPEIQNIKVRGGNALGIDVDGYLISKCNFRNSVRDVLQF